MPGALVSGIWYTRDQTKVNREYDGDGLGARRRNLLKNGRNDIIIIEPMLDQLPLEVVSHAGDRHDT
jgi:hypothetical protein